ncbi:MAG TPA: hypothetical protein VGK59_15785 [Ohtaekwangia sp.]
MSKMSREEKLFRNETNVLEHYKGMITQETSPEATKEALIKLTDRYESLLTQTRFLTWISGRLERKLQRKNRELQENNVTLQRTLNELTKAEASRNTYAIIYFIAIVLFVLEELFIEPIINMMGNSIGYGILIKLAIVLVLKMSEGFIEKKITMRKRLMRKKSV